MKIDPYMQDDKGFDLQVLLFSSTALCWEVFNSLLLIRSFVKYFIEHSKEEDLFVHFGGFTLAQATKLQRGTCNCDNSFLLPLFITAFYYSFSVTEASFLNTILFLTRNMTLGL